MLREGDWQDPTHAERADGNPRVKHELHDVLGTPDIAFHTGWADDAAPVAEPVWTGLMAYGRADAGLSSQVLPGEPASQWFHDGSAWVGTDTQLTDDEGRFDFGAPAAAPGLLERFVVLEADGSCGRQVSVRLESGAPVVITDIDETLTVADSEFFRQTTDMDYVPEAYEGGAAMLSRWVEKGVQPIYMTARPHVARAETRLWLDALGFPSGPLLTAPTLVVGDDTFAYKSLWVGRVVDDLGLDVVAAYGNATTDIDAYLTRIPAERVYIIGDHAGEQGTVGVQGGWSEHLDTVVEAW